MKTTLKFTNIRRGDFNDLPTELKNAKDIRYLIIEPNGDFTESIAGKAINTGTGGGGYQPDNTTIVLNSEDKLSVKPEIVTEINGKLDKKPDGTVDLITALNKIDARYLDIDSELFIIEASLPSTGVANKIYLVPKSGGAGSNVYDEYVWLSDKWEQIGTVTVDLSNYYNKNQTDTLLGYKQDTLTAGDGISIVGNTISATNKGYPPDEETITLNESDELEVTNVAIWRFD